MIGMILATDMADHASHINVIDFQIKDKQITKEAQNGADFIDTSGDKELFASQQQCLDLMIHACDLSTPTRKFDTLKRWTYLLFDEFFGQGDKEKEHGLNASFLCDRATTIVAKEQPGFSNFIVLPVWKLVATLLPPMEACEMRVIENREAWKTYEETEEDKEVYNVKDADGIKITVPASVDLV